MAEYPKDLDGGGGPLLTMKALRIAALVLACAGLFLLYLYAVRSEIPPVRIAEITPAMNFASVRVSGEVVRSGGASASGGWVFAVDDGSGEIAVFCSRTQTEALKAAGKIPRRGDRIETAGSLNVGAEKGIRLRMIAPEQMTILRRDSAADRSPVSLVRLSDVQSVDRGRQVMTRGLLKAVSVPGRGSKAPYQLVLEEGDCTLTVIFWDDAFSSPERTLPVPGKRIEVCGTVDRFRDQVRLKLQDLSGLRVMADEPSQTMDERVSP